MGMRWGLGPVFWWEWLRASRRWQLYALRSLFAAALGAGLTLVWWKRLAGRPITLSLLAEVGESFFYALVGTQLAVVLLAAPAYAASGFCVEKARGTLLHVLATDLSDVEIVLGKLAALLLPVLGLVLCGAPVLFGASLLGGIDPEAALGAVLVTLGVGVLGGTLALVLSVWGRQTYEVLLATYFLAAGAVFGGPLWGALGWTFGPPRSPAWLVTINPFVMAFRPYLFPATSCLNEQLLFLAVTLGLSAALVVLAVLRVRAVAVRQASTPARAWGGPALRWLGLPIDWLPGPSLDSYPVWWREWYRSRPSLVTRLAWVAYGLAALLISLMAMEESRRWGGRRLTMLANGLQVPLGLLLILIRASTSLSMERAQGRLDLLLATPLSTQEILNGKLLTCYRAAPVVAALSVLVAAAGAEEVDCWWCVLLLEALVLTYAAALTSLGLAVSVWVTRPGRALGGCVLLFVLVNVVPFLLLLLLRPPGDGWLGPALASPFLATAILTRGIQDSFRGSLEGIVMGWGVIWLILYGGAAAALYSCMLANADRCLGRMSTPALAEVLRHRPMVRG